MATSEAIVFRGTVSPYYPAVDEISAMYILERLHGSSTTDVQFHGDPRCSPKQLEEFFSRGYFPIETGEINYRSLGAGSAAEASANLLRYVAEENSGEQELFSILAEENSTGRFKSFHMSIIWMVPELYHFPDYQTLHLIERTKKVVQAFVDSYNEKSFGHREREDRTLSDALEAALPELAEVTKKCQFAPFTIGRYLRDLWRLNRPLSEINEEISFWLTAWDRFQEEYGKAKEEWLKIAKTSFVFDNKLSGVAIETSNRFVSKIGTRTVDALINRNPISGHAVFMTRKLDVSSLKKELDRLEPDRWYHHQTAGNLINGGPSYPKVRPTDLPVKKLVELIQKFPPR